MSSIVLPAPVGVRADDDVRRTRALRLLLRWIALRWKDFAVAAPIVGFSGFVHAVGMAGWPAFDNDDEGTYMAEAWAVQTGHGPHHGLAQYTYWYDHPPLGWIQLAVLTWFQRAYQPGSVAVVSGRQLMLGYALASLALTYVLARRLGCSRVFAGLGTAVFGLCPLSVTDLRLVFLDCIGLPWVLAAYVVALSPRRRLWSIAASGALFGVGVLSKETYLLLLPTLVWQVWRATRPRTRSMTLIMFAMAFAVVAGMYPLYAALKGELMPGKGHVSLIGSAFWQLDQRAGSGSVFSSTSGSHVQLTNWLSVDPWLLGVGLALVPIGLLTWRLRPVAATYAIFAATLLRHGYLPDGFVIGALPFAALIIAGSGDEAIRRIRRLADRRRRAEGVRRHAAGASLAVCALALGAVLAGLTWRVGPEWARSDYRQMTTEAVALGPIEQAERWVDLHVPKTSTLLVDDDVWTDLVDDGFAPHRVIWAYKLDLDPEVGRRFPQGWRDMDYVLLTQGLRSDLDADPVGTADPRAAVAHSRVIATFGSGPESVAVLKVDRNARSATRRVRPDTSVATTE